MFKFEALTGSVMYDPDGVEMDLRLQQTPTAWITAKVKLVQSEWNSRRSWLTRDGLMPCASARCLVPWPRARSSAIRRLRCPSWPNQAGKSRRKQTCSGTTVKPDPSTCGAGTLNPDCTPVCNGEVKVTETQAFGVIGETGDSFRLYLGGGIATNGLNSNVFYGSLTGEKAQLTIGGSHFCPTSPNTAAARGVVAWLKRFLDDDERYSSFVCAARANYRNTCPV